MLQIFIFLGFQAILVPPRFLFEWRMEKVVSFSVLRISKNLNIGYVGYVIGYVINLDELG